MNDDREKYVAILFWWMLCLKINKYDIPNLQDCQKDLRVYCDKTTKNKHKIVGLCRKYVFIAKKHKIKLVLIYSTFRDAYSFSFNALILKLNIYLNTNSSPSNNV